MKIILNVLLRSAALVMLSTAIFVQHPMDNVSVLCTVISLCGLGILSLCAIADFTDGEKNGGREEL